MRHVVTEELMVESLSRYCGFFKATNGKWYMDLADGEHEDYDAATTYGPFSGYDGAYKYLNNFSNPGGFDVDDSGERLPPTESPNGRPVLSPYSRGGTLFGRGFGGRW